MLSLQPLQDVPKLSDRAYAVIKDAILSLQIRPGATVAIGILAEQLGVSRTPVRDALLQLEKEGLVSVIPQKGALITPISGQDVREIYELRILLESYAARVAASKLTAEDHARLSASLAEAEQAFAQGKPPRAADLDRQLHELLVEKVDNERLAGFLRSLDTHYVRIRRIASALPGRFEKSHQQHIEIVAALRAADGEGAAVFMERHLSSVRDEVVAYIEQWVSENGEERPFLAGMREEA